MLYSVGLLLKKKSLKLVRARTKLFILRSVLAFSELADKSYTLILYNLDVTVNICAENEIHTTIS